MKKLASCLIYILIASTTALSIETTSSDLSVEEIKSALEAEGSIQNEDTRKIESVNSKNNKKSKRVSSKTYNSDTYEDVATYYLLQSDMIELDKVKPSYAKNKKGLLANNISVYEQKLKKEQELQKKLEKQNKIEEDSIVYLSGYCSLRNEVEIEQIQGYGLLDCSLEENELGVEATTLMVSFIPIPNKYALLAKPIYIQKNNKKVGISNGIVLTVDRTSLNIANFVNDKKLEKMTGELLTKTSQLALDSATQYMQQKEASKRSESTTYDTSLSGSQVVKTTNVEAPVASDYLVNFGIQLTSALVNVVGSLIAENNYPLFKVYKNSQFYLDASFKYSKKNKETIKYFVKDYEKINEAKQEKLKAGFKLPPIIGK